MDTLALTDRDGTYGAVKFAQACRTRRHPPGARGRPRLPADGQPRRTAGGEVPHPGTRRRVPRPDLGGLPRVTFLACADGPGGGRAGWAAMCRLVSATHLAGERGRPVATLDLLAAVAGDAAAVTVLLGPGSEIGTAVARGHGRGVVTTSPARRWRRGARLVPRRPPPGRAGLPPARPSRPRGHRGVGSRQRPARRPDGPGRPARRARQRCSATPSATPTVATPPPSTSSTPPAGWSPSTGATSTGATPRGSSSPASRCPRSPRRSAGSPGWTRSDREAAAAARPHPRRRRPVRPRPARRPRSRRGALPRVRCGQPGGSARDGRRHRATGCCGRAARVRSATATAPRPRQRIWKRLDDELELIRGLGYASYFLTVADVTDLIRELGVRCAARGSGAGSLVNYLLGVSGVDPIRHHLLMERFLSPLREALPDIDVDVESARRLEVYEADPRPLRRRALRLRLDDGHLPRPSRRPRRRRRARHAAGRDRHDRQGVPAHPRPRRPGRAARAARAAGQRARRRPARPDVPARRAARRAAPPHRGAPVRGAALRRHAARPHARSRPASPASR